MSYRTIEDLADLWRDAENHFLATGDDSRKWEVYEIQLKANLTKKEKEELEKLNQANGI